MRALVAFVLTTSIALAIPQDRFPDVPEQYTGGQNVGILVEELFQLKIVEGPAWPRTSELNRFEQAVVIYAGYRALTDPKLSRRLGNGNAWMANKLRRATSFREKELALMGVDVEGMNLHLKALELGEGFPDVPPTHWASNATKALKDKGLLKGYPDGWFRGDQDSSTAPPKMGLRSSESIFRKQLPLTLQSHARPLIYAASPNETWSLRVRG